MNWNRSNREPLEPNRGHVGFCRFSDCIFLGFVKPAQAEPGNKVENRAPGAIEENKKSQDPSSIAGFLIKEGGV